MLRLLDKETIIDEGGRYRFLSEQTFCDLTKDSDRCFVCLTAPSGETQEHVIPNWIIKLCDLREQTMRLSNGEKILYPRYKVPCCERCNQALREAYEDPISIAVKGGLESVLKLHETDKTLLLRWLNLLFFKTHYKDLSVRKHLDRRQGESTIGESYDWGVMELPHALFRSVLFNIQIASPQIGSLVIVKLLNPDWAGLWDYRDDFKSGTTYVRIGDIVLIGVLNDGGISAHAMKDRFCVESGGHVAQTLEMLTDYQVFNRSLKRKADYIKRWIVEQDYTGIRVQLPENIDIRPVNHQARHRLLWSHLEPYGELPMSGGTQLKTAKEALLAGRLSLALNPKPSSMPKSDQILSDLRRAADPTIVYGRKG